MLNSFINIVHLLTFVDKSWFKVKNLLIFLLMWITSFRINYVKARFFWTIKNFAELHNKGQVIVRFL